MLETITLALQGASYTAIALPLAFALGLVSALASACCTLPAMGMLVAYSGTRKEYNRGSMAMSALWFLIGTSLAMIIMGFVAGLIGQTAQQFLGRYWRLFAGMVAVLMGLVPLKMLPLPTWAAGAAKTPVPGKSGHAGTVFGGIILGGGVAASSLPCNPGIFIVIGASILQGRILWGMALMTAFAIGFSVPLSAILFGVSFGKAFLKAGKADAIVRTVAGTALILAGLYLLATF